MSEECEFLTNIPSKINLKYCIDNNNNNEGEEMKSIP